MYGDEQADAGQNCRTRLSRPDSRARTRAGKIQLTPSRIGNLTRFAPENLVSRERFGSPVPRQPAHLHTQAESGAYSRDPSRVPRRRPFTYFNCHTPSGQSRAYRITQLRTDGVHCRESAGTGTVNLKVVPNEECCLDRSPWTNQYTPLFPTPTTGIKWV